MGTGHDHGARTQNQTRLTAALALTSTFLVAEVAGEPAAALAGWLWSGWLPFNKQLWTPSFVLWTGGLAAVALVAAHAWIDRRGHRPWGRAFGLNAIGAYAGAWMCTVLLEGLGWMAPLYRGVFGPLGPLLGPQGQSLAFAVAFVAVWAVIVWRLDRRGWYWKI